MFGNCTGSLIAVPDITVHLNCDTCLAINLRALSLNDNDEFIFTIKNYDYLDSFYVFMFKARNTDINPETGEVVFKIPAITSKMLKPGAFYTFAVLADAYDLRLPTMYKVLSKKGNILIKYGAQDVLVKTDTGYENTEDIVAARLVTLDTIIEPSESQNAGELLNGRLEVLEEA